MLFRTAGVFNMTQGLLNLTIDTFVLFHLANPQCQTQFLEHILPRLHATFSDFYCYFVLLFEGPVALPDLKNDQGWLWTPNPPLLSETKARTNPQLLSVCLSHPFPQIPVLLLMPLFYFQVREGWDPWAASPFSMTEYWLAQSWLDLVIQVIRASMSLGTQQLCLDPPISTRFMFSIFCIPEFSHHNARPTWKKTTKGKDLFWLIVHVFLHGGNGSWFHPTIPPAVRQQRPKAWARSNNNSKSLPWGNASPQAG